MANMTESHVVSPAYPRPRTDVESETTRPLRVLIVDDSPMVRRALTAMLEARGIEVEVAVDGAQALAILEPERLDLILSDIWMPGVTGIDLLRQSRSRDPDLPVLLMTGDPGVETAAQAVELGATRYLAKPIEPGVLWEAVRAAGRLRRLARIKRDLQEVERDDGAGVELGLLSDQLDEAIEKLAIHFQPIVDLGAAKLVAYEVLCRSGSTHLPGPWQLFDAAERLGRVLELGRAIRRLAAARIGELPPDALMFVNLHPVELCDDELLRLGAGLRRHASRVVLEVTERQTLDSVSEPAARVARLKQAGYRVAVDDLGAGYAGLSSFVQLDPDIVKVDMSLVRGVDESSKKRRLIRSLVELCAEMGTRVVLEGVETVAERDALATTGDVWMQGYLFGKPRPTPEPPELPA
jgi:EAL domain-containing protein (putative c-di-GMP-specific phosphodiesterase class I)